MSEAFRLTIAEAEAAASVVRSLGCGQQLQSIMLDQSILCNCDFDLSEMLKVGLALRFSMSGGRLRIEAVKEQKA